MAGEPKSDHPQGPTKRSVAIQMTALGLEFSATVIGGMVVGWWLDDQLGTKPLFLLLGIFGGLATSMIRVVQLARQFERARPDDPE